MQGITWQDTIRMALEAKNGPWPMAPQETRNSVINLRGMSSGCLEEDPVLEKDAYSS